MDLRGGYETLDQCLVPGAGAVADHLLLCLSYRGRHLDVGHRI